MLYLGSQKLHRIGQTRGGEDFLADLFQNLLHGQAFGHALAENAEQVRLFNVLFPIKYGAHAVHLKQAPWSAQEARRWDSASDGNRKSLRINPSDASDSALFVFAPFKSTAKMKLPMRIRSPWRRVA